ncbi:MAG: GerMN domain-containing protein [Microthrixaceae bacterium]
MTGHTAPTPRILTGPTNRARHLRATLAGLAALVVAVSGCAIPLDSQPRAMEPTTTTTARPTTTQSGSGASAALYFVINGHLASTQASVATLTPTAVLDGLLKGPDSTSGSGVVGTKIPSDTILHSARLSGSHLTIDLGGAFGDLVGPVRRQALGQMVLTVTALPNVTTVSLELDGQATTLFSDALGDTTEVTACDYVELFPSDAELASWRLARRDLDDLATRRNALLRACPGAER